MELDKLTIGLLAWCGALTLLWIISIVLICVLWNKLSRFTRNSSEIPVPPVIQNAQGNINNAASVYSYGSPAIVPGEDLAKRGYAKHDPIPDSFPSPVDKQPNMKPNSSYNVTASGNTNAAYNKDDDEIFTGIVFGDDYDTSKKSKKSKPPSDNKKSSDVPHFFNSQLSSNNGPPPSTHSTVTNNPRAQSSIMSNPNFQY